MYRLGIWIITLVVAAVAAGQVQTDRQSEWTKPQWRSLEAEMAGPHTWLGTTGSVVGAWAADNFDTGLLPATGEDVWFTTRSHQDVTSGLDQSGPGELLNRIWIQAGNRSSIGTSSAPLIVDTESIIHHGSGILHYEQAEVTVALRYYIIGGITNVTPRFYFHDLVSQPSAYFFMGGRSWIGADAGITGTIYVFPSAELILEPDASNQFRSLIQTGGSVICHRSQESGTVTISAGSFLQETTGSLEAVVMYGGDMNFKGSDIDNMHILGNAIFDFTQDPRAKSIASMVIGPNAEVKKHQGITVTSLELDLSVEVPSILP